MSRTLKQQLGLARDPHSLEHTIIGGQRFTKVVTRTALEKQQPGLPVYHRRIANPIPLFCISIGACLLILGCILCGFRDLQSLQIYLNIGLPLGGFGLITACMFAFTEGNTFLATAAGIFGGILGGLSMLFLPWAGIQMAYISEANGEISSGVILLYKAVGIVFFVALIPLFLILIGSFRTAAPIATALFTIIIALIVQGSVYLNYPMQNAQIATGALFLVVGICMWYLALAVMMNEEGISLLPVLPFPRIVHY